MNASVIVDVLKRYPLALGCGLIALISLVLLFLRGGIGDELAAKESELSSRLRVIERNAAQSTNLDQEVEQLEKIVEKIDTGLFERDERAVNINFFYDFEDKVDVLISNISQTAEPDEIYRKGGPRALKLYSTLVFNLSVRGRFEDILLFCYEFTRADASIRVADLEISGGGREAESGLLTARLRVLVLAEQVED
jgi:Tfp pilus assembly protein PilO